MSPSDPAAAWTTRGRHKVQFAYSVNHLVDLLDGVIVDVEAMPTRISMEADVVETMLDRVEARFDLKPERISADIAYGTGDLLGAIVARNIAPHIPVWDKGKRDDGTLSREDFRFEPERDLYVCLAATFSKPPARCMTAGPCSTGRANTTAIPAAEAPLLEGVRRRPTRNGVAVPGHEIRDIGRVD